MVNFVLQVWSEATFSYLLTQYFFQKMCGYPEKREVGFDLKVSNHLIYILCSLYHGLHGKST